jgi:hypothetical protein
MKEVNENPTVKVSVKKNVVKHYVVDEQPTVFLQDGSEFELEFFNPLKDNILAEISINGKLLNGSGLVLRPGERVFLERYIDEDKKFKFVTYKVDKNEKVEKAIEDNGLIQISFYKEVYNAVSSYTYNPCITYGNRQYEYYSYTTGITYTSPPLATNYCTAASGDLKQVSNTADNSKKETGIVEKGKKSSQNLVYTNKLFEIFPFYTQSIKILPNSERVYTSDDFKHRKYCSHCGKKINSTDNYCSYCGNKI